MSDDPSGQSAQIEALQAEVARKEDVILKMQRGEARREDMAQQIRDIVKDRDHWKSMSEKGSKSQARKITDLQNKLVQSESKNLAQTARIAALEAENKALREGRGVKVDPLEVAELQSRLAQLEADNAAATTWGAAVGARQESIKAIRKRLRALSEGEG